MTILNYQSWTTGARFAVAATADDAEGRIADGGRASAVASRFAVAAASTFAAVAAVAAAMFAGSGGCFSEGVRSLARISRHLSSSYAPLQLLRLASFALPLLSSSPFLFRLPLRRLPPYCFSHLPDAASNNSHATLQHQEQMRESVARQAQYLFGIDGAHPPTKAAVHTLMP